MASRGQKKFNKRLLLPEYVENDFLKLKEKQPQLATKHFNFEEWKTEVRGWKSRFTTRRVYHGPMKVTKEQEDKMVADAMEKLRG